MEGAIRNALQRICKQLNIHVRSTHKARKTYASAMIDAGVNPKIVQKQLGHKDFATTKKYYDFDRSNDAYKRAEIN